MEKPDFEQIASFRSDISDHSMFLGFKAGCEHVWNTHVVPLQEENKIMFENGGKLTTKVLQLESENKALREEIERLKKQRNEAQALLNQYAKPGQMFGFSNLDV